jgi:hypothetical protein
MASLVPPTARGYATCHALRTDVQDDPGLVTAPSMQDALELVAADHRQIDTLLNDLGKVGGCAAGRSQRPAGPGGSAGAGA